jgi:putative transposase
LAAFSRAAWYRPSTARDQAALFTRIRQLAMVRPVNLERVQRMYRLEGLQRRLRVRRRKHWALHCGPAPVPSRPLQRWSMDSLHDALADGRQFRILTVVDQWSRQSPILEVGFRMDGTTVSDALDAAFMTYGKPASITCDHGTESMSRVLEDWAYTRRVLLDFTRPGQPTGNSYIEFFNGKLTRNIEEFR